MRIVGVAVLLASFAALSETNSPPALQTNTISESVLLARIPQLVVKRDDLAKQGWETPGKVTDKYIYFVRTNYSISLSTTPIKIS
jgi:hypothetical protein